MKKIIMTALFTGLVFAFLVSTDAMAKDKSSDGESAIQFIELNPLILPIISERGVTQMVSLVVSVEVDSEEKANQVRKYQPRLTDAFLSDLYGWVSRCRWVEFTDITQNLLNGRYFVSRCRCDAACQWNIQWFTINICDGLNELIFIKNNLHGLA
jgi:hypothetical protein